MDQYFRDSYWFVPMSKLAGVGSKDRERDLAMGESLLCATVFEYANSQTARRCPTLWL
jgi:hypothetical protein